MTYLDKINKESLHKFLAERYLAACGTLTEMNEIRLATILYIIGEDFTIYFMTKVSSEKYKNLTERNGITLLVTDEKTLMTAQVQGQATVENDAKKIRQMIVKMSETVSSKGISWPPPIDRIDESDFAVVRVDPRHIVWTDFTKFSSDSRSSRSPFYHFDF